MYVFLVVNVLTVGVIVRNREQIQEETNYALKGILIANTKLLKKK